MPVFSKRSQQNLDTCHDDLKLLLNECIKHIDFSIIGGFRDSKLQNLYYEQGKSKLKFPHSRHNRYPSEAVDLIPYPFTGWNDIGSFGKMAGYIMRVADELGIEIEWGGDWKTFKDYPHIELRKS